MKIHLLVVVGFKILHVTNISLFALLFHCDLSVCLCPLLYFPDALVSNYCISIYIYRKNSIYGSALKKSILWFLSEMDLVHLYTINANDFLTQNLIKTA